MANLEAASSGLKNSLAAEIEGAIRELDDRGLNYATQWYATQNQHFMP